MPQLDPCETGCQDLRVIAKIEKDYCAAHELAQGDPEKELRALRDRVTAIENYTPTYLPQHYYSRLRRAQKTLDQFKQLHPELTDRLED